MSRTIVKSNAVCLSVRKATRSKDLCEKGQKARLFQQQCRYSSNNSTRTCKPSHCTRTSNHETNIIRPSCSISSHQSRVHQVAKIASQISPLSIFRSDHVSKRTAPPAARAHYSTVSSSLHWPRRSVPLSRPKIESRLFSSAAGQEEADSTDSKFLGSSQISEHVKTLMRQVPHPIAIITSTNPTIVNKSSGSQPTSTSERWKGATVSSFNTVTLTPMPIVSFNIKKLSATFDAIDNSGLFNVHVLAADSAGIELAGRFAMGNALAPFENIPAFVSTDSEWTQEKADGRHDAGQKGHVVNPPTFSLRTNNGDPLVLFRLRCRCLRDKLIGIGDHVVVLGVVEAYEVLSTSPAQPQSQIKSKAVLGKSLKCLMYVDGRYTEIEDGT